MILDLEEAEKYASEHPHRQVEYIGEGYFKVEDTNKANKMDEHQYDIVSDGKGIPSAVKGYLEEETKYGIRQDGKGRFVIENLEDADKDLEGRIDGW